MLSTFESPSEAPLLVLPFYRAAVRIRHEQRALFSKHMPDSEFLRLLGRSPLQLRQNVRRILAASILARRGGGILVSVEGWKGNRINRHGRADRFVTGSYMTRLLHRMLRRRRLITSSSQLIVALDFSRCTREEVCGVEAIAQGLGGHVRFVGIAESPGPSVSRAAFYLRRSRALEGRVLAPAGALALVLPTAEGEQTDVLRACKTRGPEKAMWLFLEGASWLLLAFSLVLMSGGEAAISLEQRLARKFRRDR